MSALLYRTGQGIFTLNAATGFYEARVSLGPITNDEQWVINRMQVFTTNVPATTLFKSTCQVFRDFEGPSGYVDGTSKGDSNSSELNNLVLGTFNKLIFVWQATDASFLTVYATAVVQGVFSNGFQ